MKSICEILRESESDKEQDGIHRYGEVYDILLGKYRDKPGFSLLEIGVHRGASLKAWEEAFPKGSIWGIDSNTVPGVKMLTGDAYHAMMVNQLFDFNAKFDVIIDDGSHTYEHHQFFFAHYQQFLKPGGIIIAEDCMADPVNYTLAQFTQLAKDYDLTIIDTRNKLTACWCDLILFKIV